MATYLEQRHWQQNSEEHRLTATISTRRLNKHPPNYEIPHATPEYVTKLLKEFHANKAPGPDYLEADLFKVLPTPALQIIADHLNEWIRTGTLRKEELQARVASLFKKGDFRNAENYRPISLLNTIYKLKATFLKYRLEEGGT